MVVVSQISTMVLQAEEMNKHEDDDEKYVMVTGITGFIGAHVTEWLLNQGYRVVGTMRGRKVPDYLVGMGHRLEVVTGVDLTEPGARGLRRAIALRPTLRAILHVASPYRLDVSDVDRDLVQPAVLGTLAVMQAAWDAPLVRRVVLTSSVAAVFDGGRPDHRFTEADWNQSSSRSDMPYYFSKTSAERAAWQFVRDHAWNSEVAASRSCPFRLVVLNPYMVIGPAHSRAVNESVRFLRNLMNGGMPAVMNVGWGFVDVRDVARAHGALLECESAQGRYLCSHPVLPLAEIERFLRESYPDYSYPRVDLSRAGGLLSALIYVAAYSQPRGERQWIQHNLNHLPALCARKLLDLPGFAPLRPLEQSLLDTVENLIFHGHIPPSIHSPATRRPTFKSIAGKNMPTNKKPKSRL